MNRPTGTDHTNRTDKKFSLDEKTNKQDRLARIFAHRELDDDCYDDSDSSYDDDDDDCDGFFND